MRVVSGELLLGGSPKRRGHGVPQKASMLTFGRRPKGLACIIPWEGMSDYYRDRCRHGGILSNTFISFWWNRQVVSNQYGLAGRAARQWGSDTIEGDRTKEQLEQSRHDQTIDNEMHRFLDESYYSSRDYNLLDIEVPLLSVANWGGILLHLRGNVQGYLHAGSKLKFLRFITGRHDLPFYLPKWVALQESFLNAFLKGEDKDGWTTGNVAPVGLVLRKGDIGYNNAEAEEQYPTRYENEWPLARTKYSRYYLTHSGGLSLDSPDPGEPASSLSYRALGSLWSPQCIQFSSAPAERGIEFTGHIVAHLHVSCTRDPPYPNLMEKMDLDIFLTLRHFAVGGTEVLYTGTVGDPVPLTKGWLRASLRKTNPGDPRHVFWHPHREYRGSEAELLTPGAVYEVDVEIWPTNVVLEKGDRLVFELSSGDTQGAGLFEHNSSRDRSVEVFGGINHLHFGKGRENWILMPEIPDT